MYRTIEQNNRLHGLCGALSIDKDHLRDLVLEFTQGRTDSSKLMEVMECNALITHLAAKQHQGVMANKMPSAPKKNVIKLTTEQKEKQARMLRKVFACCHQLGWYRAGVFKEDGTPVLDYDRIDKYCMKHGAAHKPIKDYPYSELHNLVNQFDNMVKYYLNKAK